MDNKIKLEAHDDMYLECPCCGLLGVYVKEGDISGTDVRCPECYSGFTFKVQVVSALGYTLE